MITNRLRLGIRDKKKEEALLLYNLSSIETKAYFFSLIRGQLASPYILAIKDLVPSRGGLQGSYRTQVSYKYLPQRGTYIIILEFLYNSYIDQLRFYNISFNKEIFFRSKVYKNQNIIRIGYIKKSKRVETSQGESQELPSIS